MSDSEGSGPGNRTTLLELPNAAEGSGLQYTDYSTLHGFWRGENAKPGPVKHISGDVEKFKDDLEKCKERTRTRLDRMQGNRFMLIASWPEEALLVDEWCDDSISYVLDKGGNE